MTIVLTVLWFLLALGILVTIHEFGHFYIARRCGVKVLRFSIGFGQPLYTWRDSSGTEYTLAAIPLGGYVKMLDEREGEVKPSELALAFTQKPVWQRMAIVVAGPVANFILAIVLYFILALMGGNGIAPVVGELPAEGLAAISGVDAGDEIVAVDGERVNTWSTVFAQLLRRVGDTGSIRLDLKTYDPAMVELPQRTVYLPIDGWLRDDDQPNFFAELGIQRFSPDIEPIIEQVLEGSAAEVAGLQPGDRILQADGQGMATWQQWVDYVRARPDVTMNIQVERGKQITSLALTPQSIERDGESIGQAGVSVSVAAVSLAWPKDMLRPVEYSFPNAMAKGVTQTWEQATFILLFIKKLVLAEVSTKNLSGTFTIAQVAGESAKAGLASYLAFLAFLSVSLGVFNLLPIPVLDGGHLLYYTIELIKGSPVSEKIQLIGYQMGLFFILGIMIVAHVNDLIRIFS
ncbi:MAG: regulator of sigma E protease [Kiritimatiellia bacterium]|jgi:regulator of sigma E protease